jgi:NADH-quinone oxidoreductase subunit G
MTDVADATAETPPKTTLTVTIDGVPIEANPGELLIAAAERTGTYIPRFCWHPRMSSVGMCRQCIVQVEGPRGPALAVSCMQTVAEGMVVHTKNDTVKKAQEGVLEFLLVNHPLDCPVCDKGGECPLQDQAFSHGPGESRFVEEKRHYEKPIPISDLVFLDRERCVLCDRCTRFAKEVAGDPLIHFVSRGNDTQVLTFPDEPFSSYFSGNTVQICPVGALTAKPFRFKARPWDLEQRESTCTQCSVGCRVTVQSSRDQLLRYVGVDSDPVNWGWLCDKGRFSFESTNSERRVTAPHVREGGELVTTTWPAALASAASLIAAAVRDGGAGSVAVIGGARGTNEGAFAWAKLAHDVIGTAHTDAQLGDGLPADALLGVRRATIDEVCAAKTIILLGPDLKEELPVLFLRVRDSVEKRTARLLEITPVATGLSRSAWLSVRSEPGRQADAVREVLARPEVREQLAKGPVGVIVGRSSLAESAAFSVAAMDAVLAELPDAAVLPVVRRGNALGAVQAGMTPQPGGLDTIGILQAAADGKVGCLVLLGADPLADVPDRALAERGLRGAQRVIAVDTMLTGSSSLADVVLPAAAAGETDGSVTNLEGRVSSVASKVTPKGMSRADWLIAAELALRLGGDLGLESVDAVTDAIAATVPGYAGITAAVVRRPGDGHLTAPEPSVARSTAAAPEAPLPDGYGLRLVASRKLYDAGVGVQESQSMSQLAPGARLHLNSWDANRYSIGDGAPVRVSSTRTALVLDARIDDGVPRGSAWVAYAQPNAPVSELIDITDLVTTVRVENL